MRSDDPELRATCGSMFLPHLRAPDSLPRAGDGLSFFRRRKTRTAEASRRDAREVDEFTAITEEWGHWSDGVGELVPYCSHCARREFAPNAQASGRVPIVPRRDERR